MTIKVKYETYRTDKPPIETIIEVPDDECAIMIETDYQRRLEVAEDKQSVERREIQEIFTEDFNKPLYNNWHKANRHKGELSIPFRKDDEDADETDGLDFVPDYSDEERRERKEDYDAVCQKLRMMLKSEYAEVLIAIVLDGKTPEEYADEIGVHRDAIYKRLQRAKKKCAKVFWYVALNSILNQEEAALRAAAPGGDGYRPVVYVCSPYSGNVEENVQNARHYCRFALENRTIPLAPHLLYPQFMDDNDPAERYLAMHTINHVLLGKCRELWVFGDVITEGMEYEIILAKRWQKNIRYFSGELKEVR